MAGDGAGEAGGQRPASAPRRVFVVSVEVGAGHRDAARALVEPMQRRWPDASIRLTELLDWSPRWFRRLYGGGYARLASGYPGLYWWLFRRSDEPRQLQQTRGERWRVWFEAGRLQRFIRLVRQESPELVVQTHFLGAEILGRAICRAQVHTRQCVVVTDYEAHRAWRCEAVERYFVGSPLAKAALERGGVEPQRVLLTGVPIGQAWTGPIDPQRVRQQWHLAEDRPTVVVMGGTLFPTGPIHQAADELLAAAIPMQLVILAGRHPALAEGLAQRYANRPYVQVLGYTDRLHELFAVADLLISKPGGLVITQATQMHLPMIIMHPVLGQETANADYLLSGGAAIKCNSVRTLSAQVRWLLEDAGRLRAMGDAAGRLARPLAAEHIADALAALFVPPASELVEVVARR